MPTPYLAFKALYVNDSDNGGKLDALYLLTVVNDSIYKSAGFKYIPLDPIDLNPGSKLVASDLHPVTTLTKEFKFVSSDPNDHNNDKTTSVVASDFTDVTYGLVGNLDVSELVAEDGTYVVLPYWITYDDEIVYGTTVRKMIVDTTTNKVSVSDFEIPSLLFVDFTKGEWPTENGTATADWSDGALMKACFVYVNDENKEQQQWEDFSFADEENRIGYCDVPADKNVTKLILVRGNPDYQGNDFFSDGRDGKSGFVWNQTGDIPFGSYEKLSKNYIKWFKDNSLYDNGWVDWGVYPS